MKTRVTVMVEMRRVEMIPTDRSTLAWYGAPLTNRSLNGHIRTDACLAAERVVRGRYPR